jgi:HEAT repeat protein
MAKENPAKKGRQKKNNEDQAIDSLKKRLDSYCELHKEYKSPIQFPFLASLYQNRKRIKFDKEKLPLILRSALEEDLGLGWYWLKELNEREMLEIIKNFLHEKTEVMDQIIALFPEVMGRENLKEVIKMLRDKDLNAQAAAASALVKLATPEDKEDLIKMLDDEDWYVRKTSLKALCKMIEPQDEEKIVERLHDENQEVRKTAAEVFEKMANPQDKEKIIEMLHDKDEYIRDMAARVFARIVIPEDRENIIGMLQNVEVCIGKMVVEALETITLEDKEYVMDAIREYIRRAALDAFTKIATPEDNEDLVKMLRSEDWYVRKTSLKALCKVITPENKEDIITPQEKKNIIEMLCDVDEDVKEAAAELFSKVAIHQDKEKIIEMLHDEDEFVREVAGRVFPYIIETNDSEDIVETLQRKDETWEVRRPSAEAFAKIATPKDRKYVTEMLYDEDCQVQKTAVRIFVSISESHEIDSFLDFLSEKAQVYGEKEKRHFRVLSMLDRELYCRYSSTIERVRLKKESRIETADSDVFLDLVDYLKNEGKILKKDLRLLNCGPEEWRQYEELVIRIFKYLFVPPLKNPFVQKYTYNRLERRDALFPNHSDDSFWKIVREKHDGEFILVECKNHCGKIGKREVQDASQYLRKKYIGRFGLITSRKPPSKSAIEQRKKEYEDDNKLILFLDDKTLKEMIEEKIQERNPTEILSKLRERFLIGG